MPLPLVADLLETCVDDVIRAPVPMATAGLPEEAGPSMAASASSLTADDTVSLAGELTHTHTDNSHANTKLIVGNRSSYNLH